MSTETLPILDLRPDKTVRFQHPTSGHEIDLRDMQTRDFLVCGADAAAVIAALLAIPRTERAA